MIRTPLLFTFASLVLAAVGVTSGDSIGDDARNRRRGIAPAHVPHYQRAEQSGTFACIDGSQTIPWSDVNDDYCDCADGSDEPGTSACAPIGQFYCTNAGFEPTLLHSTKVNDRICDCCDGSDEWATDVECPNTCSERGAKKVRAQAAKLVATRRGLKAKEALTQGVRERYEKEVGQLDEQRAQLADIELQLNEARLERDQAQLALDAARAVVVSENTEREAAMPDAGSIAYAREDDEGDESDEGILEADGDDDDDDDDDEEEEEGEEEDEESEEESGRGKKTNRSGRRFKRDDELLKPRGPDGSLSTNQQTMLNAKRALEDAQNQVNVHEEAERSVRDAMRDAEKLAQIDFGLGHAWYALYEHEVSLEQDGYRYTLRLFNDVRQGSTPVGNFERWSSPSGHTRMRYGGGRKCWNGPNRSADVYFECGDETRLVRIAEPNKCEYEITVETPIACSESEQERLELWLDENKAAMLAAEASGGVGFAW